MTKINIKQDDKKPIPIDIIADSIVSISKGIKKIRCGKLTDNALFLLIQNACPTKKLGKKVGLTEIRSVFEGIENLEKRYIKKVKK